MGRDDLVGKRKDQVVARRAVHVNRVRVGALHVQSSPSWDEQNVGFVSAAFLIEKASCRREIKVFYLSFVAIVLVNGFDQAPAGTAAGEVMECGDPKERPRTGGMRWPRQSNSPPTWWSWISPCRK